MRVDGLSGLIARLAAAQTAVPKAAEFEVRNSAEDLLSRSVPLAPVDIGTLRASGYVEPSSGLSNGYVTVGYGGAASDYMWVQHEGVGMVHQTGGPKFLETPWNENRATYARRIQAAARVAVRGI